MSDHAREPIKATCPDINKIQGRIKDTISEVRYAQRSDSERDKNSALSDAESMLDEVVEFLEEMRTSNGKLREWGNEEAEALDTATADSEYHERQASHYKSLSEDLQAELDEIKAKYGILDAYVRCA